jgi:hypothetical protein
MSEPPCHYVFMRPRSRLLVATALIAASLWGAMVHAANAPVCGALCGKWQLDASRSDDPKALLDAAMATFKEPRPRRQDRMPRTLEGDIGARVDESLGPINTRPLGSEVRRELDRLLRVPEQLMIELQGREFRLGALTGSPRRLTPGESYARVDAEGTAEIRCNFNEGRLQVTERYDRRRQYSETYALQRGDGSLLVTREVKRQGLKPLIIKSRYRPL